MYPHSFLWHYLWLAPHVIQIPIAIVLYRRGWFREFPVFFAYTLFQPIAEGILFLLDHSAAVSAVQYWYVHWAGLGVDITLRFSIILEIFSSVFEKYPGIRQLGLIVFRVAAALLLFTAVAVVARAPQRVGFQLLSRIHLLNLGVSVVQSGLLLVLIGFSAYFRLSWRSFAYGIALGLGIFASVDLATETMRVWTGYVAGYAFDFVTMATYHCCVLIWLAYVLAPEKVYHPVKDLPEHNLEQWNTELQRLLLQ